jgi:hypothetical protein
MCSLGKAPDKYSSLLRKSVNYGRKKFYSAGPCLLSLSVNDEEEKFNDINLRSFGMRVS